MKAQALRVCVCVCVCVCGHFILYIPLFLEVVHSDFFVCSVVLVDTEKHTGPEVKTFFMLNWTEHEISSAHKNLSTIKWRKFLL